MPAPCESALRETVVPRDAWEGSQSCIHDCIEGSVLPGMLVFRWSVYQDCFSSVCSMCTPYSLSVAICCLSRQNHTTPTPYCQGLLTVLICAKIHYLVCSCFFVRAWSCYIFQAAVSYSCLFNAILLLLFSNSNPNIYNVHVMPWLCGRYIITPNRIKT